LGNSAPGIPGPLYFLPDNRTARAANYPHQLSGGMGFTDAQIHHSCDRDGLAFAFFLSDPIWQQQILLARALMSAGAPG
jgi:hypothetical protein